LRFFLPKLVADYRNEHNAVTFELLQRYGDEAEASLISLDADLAFVFAPVRTNDFQVTATARQTVHCLMSATHPLAQKDTIRLRDCIGVPAILPTPKSGVRQLLDVGLMKRNIQINTIIETDSFEFMQNYLIHENAISFQIPISLEHENTPIDAAITHGIVARPFDSTDIPAGILHIGQLKGRVLPVAAAKFLDNVIHLLGQQYPDGFDQ
jgi:DNA-binding transcriptional LysR family regulator